MIAFAVQALKLASLALPLLLSVRDVLPTAAGTRLAHRSGEAVLKVMDIVSSLEGRIECATGAPGADTHAEVTASNDSDSTTAPLATASTGRGEKISSGKATGNKAPKAAAGASLAPPDTDSSDSSKETGQSSGDAERETSTDDDGDEEGHRWWDDEGEDGDANGTGHGHVRSNTPITSFGSDPVYVPAGEFHRGDIVCIGGDVRIDGEVRGDVVVVGGVLTVRGTVRQGVVAVASKVHLGETAIIRRDFVSVAGSVYRARTARIGGEYHSVDLPNLGRFATGHGVVAYVITLFLFFSLLVTAFRFLAVLVVAAIAPGRVEGALTVPRQSWVAAFFLGFAVHLFAGLVGLLLLPVCGVGLVVWLGVRVAVWMGLASIYLEIGRNLAKTAFKTQLSYFGSILLGFAIFAVIGMVPIIGWVVTGVTSCIALGLMVLTRFGSGPRRLHVPTPPAVPAPRPAPGPLPGTAPSPGVTS